MGRKEAASYSLGKLDFSRIYYWGVDKGDDAPDFTVFRGDIWRFKVEPFGMTIARVTATSSSASPGMEASKTIDGSGLNGLDQHSTRDTDMWLSTPGEAPWIEYRFDRIYELDEMWVWNSNQVIERLLGLGAKNVLIEYSTDGATWMTLEGASQLAQAPGKADYAHNTIVDFHGVLAKYVRITVSSGWGVMPQYGLSEVRFFHIPTQAQEPQPATGATTKGVDVLLKWRAGREADLHEISLSTNSAAMTDGTAVIGTSREASFDPGALNYATTYFWKVDEINEAETPTVNTGKVWSFSTPAYGTVDDFDLYDDNCKRIFFAWEDGLGHNGSEGIENCEVSPSDGNGGRSVVGHDRPPFAEQTIVNVGSRQSMPLSYDNANALSETTLMINGQDWTASGIRTFSLFFYGQANNSGQLYVKINDIKVVYHGDVTQTQWQQWPIDLTSMDGLENVTTLTIGVEGNAAAGMLYIDDIRLYP